MRAIGPLLAIFLVASCTSSSRQVSPPPSEPSLYAERIRQSVQRNIVFTQPISGNPAAEVEARTAAGGEVIGVRLAASSGVPDWDNAVQLAIRKTGRIPLDVDGRIPAVLMITFRPKAAADAASTPFNLRDAIPLVAQHSLDRPSLPAGYVPTTGVLVLALLIDSEGQVAETLVLSSSGDVHRDRSVQVAFAGKKFTPARTGVKLWINVEVRID